MTMPTDSDRAIADEWERTRKRVIERFDFAKGKCTEEENLIALADEVATYWQKRCGDFCVERVKAERRSVRAEVVGAVEKQIQLLLYRQCEDLPNKTKDCPCENCCNERSTLESITAVLDGGCGKAKKYVGQPKEGKWCGKCREGLRAVHTPGVKEANPSFGRVFRVLPHTERVPCPEKCKGPYVEAVTAALDEGCGK